MDEKWSEFASEVEKFMNEEKDFSDEGRMKEVSAEVWNNLGKYMVGPAALSLLVVFAFPQEKREQLWNKIREAVSGAN